MSHFVVLVFGKDVDGQLAKYDEELQMDPYWVDEVTNVKDYWAYQKFVDEQGMSPEATMEELLATMKVAWGDDGSEYRIENGVLQRQTTYNPDSKWDWYVTGGRWKDMLLLKDGSKADEAYNYDIDWVGMDLFKGAAAEELIDKVLDAIRGLPMMESFAKVRERFDDSEEGVAKAREAYHGQPMMVALRESKVGMIWGDPVEIFCLDQPDPKAAYIKAAIDSTVGCYAVVKDGEWITQGRMGWWGMSSDDMSDAEWFAKVRKLIDDNPSEYLTIIDAHI